MTIWDIMWRGLAAALALCGEFLTFAGLQVHTLGVNAAAGSEFLVLELKPFEESSPACRIRSQDWEPKNQSIMRQYFHPPSRPWESRKMLRVEGSTLLGDSNANPSVWGEVPHLGRIEVTRMDCPPRSKVRFMLQVISNSGKLVPECRRR